MALDKKHAPLEYAHFLDDICDDLMGQQLADCEDDIAGTYFDREHWVSAEGIAQALIWAFEAGLEHAGYRR